MQYAHLILGILSCEGGRITYYLKLVVTPEPRVAFSGLERHGVAVPLDGSRHAMKLIAALRKKAGNAAFKNTVNLEAMEAILSRLE